jgi:hypothetical protein
MMNQSASRTTRLISILVLVLTSVGCVPQVIESPTATPSATLTPAPTLASSPTAAPSSEDIANTPASTPETVAAGNILYHDDFTNPSTGWLEAKFDNYFVGYHEPEYYHIEIDSPNSKETAFIPGKPTFEDVTIEVKVQTNSTRTSTNGDFAYGPVFRRSGDQYYAFAISSVSKKWYVLKSSPTELTTLAEGTDNTIHGPDENDTLRVDAQGANFFFHINSHLVAQLTDPEYASGEVGFYVQTFDNTQAHIHFDDLTVKNFEAPSPLQPQTNLLYHDDFTNPSTGWLEAKFDNYFVGYHEPEYYHIEIDSPNSKKTAFIPGKPTFEDVTIEVKVQTNSTRTSTNGDFAYGPVFRRSGDQYYAFAISSVSKKWYLLKSSPTELTTLAEGTDNTIHGPDENDTLRVDAQGANFFLHINGHLIGQFTDPDYASGEVGFYVQTFDNTQAHIHFDELSIWDFEAPGMCNISTTAKLNVRSGPGTTFPATLSLSKDDKVEPLGHSPDGKWIKIGLEGSEEQGWVSNTPDFVSCNIDVAALPVIIGP